MTWYERLSGTEATTALTVKGLRDYLRETWGNRHKGSLFFPLRATLYISFFLLFFFLPSLLSTQTGWTCNQSVLDIRHGQNSSAIAHRGKGSPLRYGKFTHTRYRRAASRTWVNAGRRLRLSPFVRSPVATSRENPCTEAVSHLKYFIPCKQDHHRPIPAHPIFQTCLDYSIQVLASFHASWPATYAWPPHSFHLMFDSHSLLAMRS